MERNSGNDSLNGYSRRSNNFGNDIEGDEIGIDEEIEEDENDNFYYRMKDDANVKDNN